MDRHYSSPIKNESRSGSILKVNTLNDGFELEQTSTSFDEGASTGSSEGFSEDHRVDEKKTEVTFFDRKEIEKLIFQKARQYLNPGPLYRYFVYLFAERKLLVFFWAHLMSTLVVWGTYDILLSTIQQCQPLIYLIAVPL